jgi:hypothetical protein
MFKGLARYGVHDSFGVPIPFVNWVRTILRLILIDYFFAGGTSMFKI